MYTNTHTHMHACMHNAHASMADARHQEPIAVERKVGEKNGLAIVRLGTVRCIGGCAYAAQRHGLEVSAAVLAVLSREASPAYVERSSLLAG